MTILVLVIAVGVAIVLVVPVRIDLELDMAAAPSRRSVRVQVRWLFFAWRSGTPRRASPERAPRPRSRTHSGRRLRPRRILAAIRTRGFLGRTGRLAGDLMRALAPPTVDGWVRFGFEDPAFTGALFGVAHAAAGVTQATGWALRLEPEFSGPALAGHARVVWAVRPGAVLWPVGTFVLSPITWRAVLATLRTK